MPSFASALSLGRGGRDDIASHSSPHSAPAPAPRVAKARSTSLFAKAPKTPLETATAVLSRPALTPGSSCSSDGSASLRTPEDEAVMPPFPKSDEKKRWSSWFGLRKPNEKENDTVPGVPPKPDRPPPQGLTASRSKGDMRPPLLRESRQSTSDSDDDDDSSSGSSGSPETSTTVATRSVPPRPTIAQARANMRTLLRNTLSCPPSPPPLVETTSATLFPRSSAFLGRSQHAISLASAMHVRKMLWRLDHQTLSGSEVDSILSLARKPRPKDASQNRVEKRSDDDIIAYATMRVGRYSRGLRNWALRANFEQRFLVWMPDKKGNVTCRTVMGVQRGLAVCDLEFSEGIEALAGLDLDDETFEQNLFPPMPPPKRPVLKSIPRAQSSPPSTPRKTSFHRTPSSLRIDHAAPAEPIVSAVSPLSSVVPEKSASVPMLDTKSSKLSRGSAPLAERAEIRLSADDEELDDSIPLGYALRAKKRREGKAKFLQAEQDKREKELALIEKQKREIESRRALDEQRRKEEERRRIAEEKGIREERIKEKYNEEIAAARQRRENARMGMDSYLNIREIHQRDNGRTYGRPAYDTTPPPVQLPRRSNSAFAAPGEGLAKASSVNSRPNSIAESSGDRHRTVAPSSFNIGAQLADESRSIHHRQTSGTDAPQRPQQLPRPPSIASSSSRPLPVHRPQSIPNAVPMMPYPMMPVMPQMPPVPPMPPMSMWNMPLLPPNAPFMMQQYSRSPSPGSSPHSRDHSPSGSPARRASDAPPPSPSRRQSGLHSSSSPSPSRSQHSGQSPSRPTHSRRPSGDKNQPHPSSERRGSNSGPQRPSRSTSYSTLQQSVSQPIYRDDGFQRARRGSSTALGPANPNRRTSMM